MARGNQRDKAREKNQKEAAAVVSAFSVSERLIQKSRLDVTAEKKEQCTFRIAAGALEDRYISDD